MALVGAGVVAQLWFVAGVAAVSHHKSPWIPWTLGATWLLIGALWALRFRRSMKADPSNGPYMAPGA
jgi:hypothetical protein